MSTYPSIGLGFSKDEALEEVDKNVPSGDDSKKAKGKGKKRTRKNLRQS